jgi:hypothetical protein
MEAVNVQWIRDLQTGLREAGTTGRPVLLDFFKEG